MAIPFLSDISGQGATFVGDVTMTQTSGNNILYINSSAGGNPVIYMEDSAVKWGQFVASGELYFKNETTNVNTLKLIGSNATFAGQITTTQNQITTNIGTTSAIRLKPGSTTNTTGKSSIFLGTSPVDNYGISLRGARLGSDGTPTFELATHDGSANGTVALSIDNSQNATFTGNIRTGGTAITANTNFDNLVIEGTSHTGISIISGSTGTNSDGGIYFGDQAANNLGQIKYLHSSNAMTFATNDGNASLTLDSGLNATFAGSVGIGKTPSQWILDVDSADAYIGSFDGSGNTGVVLNSNNSTAAQIIGYSNSVSAYNDLDIRSNSTAGSGVYIDGSTSRVGIGTTSPSTFLQVSGQGNRAGGNIQMGLSSQGASKWSYLTGTHYNSTTEPEGFALIGGYSDIDENRVVIGGDIWETNPSTSIHFWTHSSSTHAQGGTQKMVIKGDGKVGIGQTLPTHTLHVKNSTGDVRGIMIEQAVSASYAELAIKSDLREFRLGTGGNGTNNANAENLFYIYDATTGGGAGHRFEINSDGDVQARRPRSNTAGDVALSLQPTDSTIHYGFRIDQETNSFNLDRVDSAGQLLRVDASGNGTFTGTVKTPTLLVNATAVRESASKLSVQGGMSEFETGSVFGNDWANSPVSILERGNIASGSSDDKYAPNLNFHWSSRVSNSLWMSDNGHLHYGSYSSAGVPSTNGTFKAGYFHGDGSNLTGVTVSNADTVDNLHAASFLRSDANDTATGNLTFSGTTKHDGGLYFTGDTHMGFVPYPKGAQYRSDSSTDTGYILIKLPTDTGNSPDDMMSFYVDIYDYTTNEMISVFVGGYTYRTTSTSTYWYNCTAIINTKRQDKDFNVRFGHDGTNYYVAIGETTSVWAHPSIVVRDFQCSYRGNAEHYVDGWAISTETTTLSGVDETQSGNLPSANGTFAGDVKIQKNTPLLELGTSNVSTGNSKLTFFSKNNSSANAYSLQFNKDTNIDRLEFIDGSGNANIKFNNGGSATFAGDITSTGLTVDYTGNRTGDAGILVTNDNDDWGIKVDKDGTADYGILSQTDGDNAIVVRNAAGAQKIQLQGDGDAAFAGNISAGSGTFSAFVYAEDEIHLTDAGTTRAKLLLNSSDRDNVELRAESLGSTMKFFTVGTEALELDASQNATFAGDVQIDGSLTGVGAFVPVGGGTFTGRISHPHKKYCDVSISNSYVRVYATGTTNSQLATIVRLTGTSHGSSHVGTFTAKIMVGHYRDVQIESMQGFYPDDTSGTTIPTLKVEGDGNGQYTLSMKTASTSAATYYFTIESLSDQTSITTLPSSTASTTISHEHECTQGKNLTHVGRNNQTKIFKIQGDADFNGTLNVVNHASTSSVATQFINGKRTSGTVPIGELIFSNNNDSVATVAGYRDGANDKGSLLFQTQDGSNGFGTRLTIKADGVSTFEKNLKANENLFVSGDGSVFGNASGLFVDSASTNYNIQAADGIAFGGSAFTFANMFGDDFGNITLAANAYPANTGSASKITFKTSTQSGGTYTPLKIKGKTSTFGGQIAGQDGTDLVTNGSFSGVSDGTDVASLTGWDAYGSVTSRNITSEQLVLVTTAANTGASLTVTTVVGQVYHVTADTSGDTGTNGIHVNTTAEGSINHSTRDGVDFYFTAAATSTIIYFRASTNAAGTINFDNVSVKEVVGYHLGDGRLNITKQAAGDARLKLVTTSGGDPNITFNSKAANRSAVINFQDQGVQSGQITYKHNGDTMEFYTGGASSAGHLELKLNETTGATFRTKATFGGDVLPSADASKNLGSGALRWATLRANYGDFNQSSTTDPVLRLTDAGVANYDVVFPDTSTYRLQTDTSSTKTFDIKNLGSGGFNLEVGGAISSSGGDLMLSSGKLNVTGAGSFITHGTSWGQNLKLTNTNDDVSPPILTFLKEQASGHSAIADNDYVGFTNYRMKNTNGDEFSWVELSALAKDVTDGSEDSAYRVGVWGGGTEQPNAIYTSADANGVKIGLGTASPDKCLTVYAPTYAGIDIKTGGGKLWEAEQWFADEGYQGMYKAGVKKIQFRADGDSYFNSGKLGVGTTGPGAQLHNYSTGTADTFISGYGTAAQNNWRGEHAFFVHAGNGIIIGKANASNDTNRLYTLYNDAQGNAEMYMYNTSNSNTIKLDSAGTSYFNGGDIIIGATAINGTFGASNTILAVKGSTSGGEGILQITGLGNNATDNVGRIDFHSQAEADPMASIRSVRGNADDVGELEFFTNSGGTPTKALTIDSNQNAVFAGPVWVSDYIYHTGDSGTKFGFSANDTFVVRNAGAVRLTVASNGDCTATGDVVAYSDERLKTNIKTLDGSKVYEMRGVSFIKEDKEGSGVIAQELEKIAPELVNSDSEYKAVAYGNLTGYLIEAIKELKAEIEELKSNKCNCNK